MNTFNFGDTRTITPRDYQKKVHHDCRLAFAAGHRSILMVAPTGAGKTIMGAMVIESAVQKERTVMFLAHRRELIHQTCDKLRQFGIDHGVIMAGEDGDMLAPVQVVSIDTLRARAMKTDRISMPQSDLVIIDEAHRSLSPTYVALINHYRESGAAVIGLTATPCRGDGRGLGHVYDTMVQAPTVRELTDMGHLVECRYYAPTKPDLSSVKIQQGDYAAGQLEDAMDKPALVGDVVAHWFKLAEGRPTIVFASGVRHSMHLRDEFGRNGAKFAHIDGNTPRHERDQILEDTRAGKYQGIVNCMVLTEGFDMPKLSCCVLARPTKSLVLYLQMAGRTLRPCDGKQDTMIIDHSGAVYEHGFVDRDHAWSLDENGSISGKEAAARAKEPTEITCSECAAIYRSKPACPECGHVPKRTPKQVEVHDGELEEIVRQKRQAKKDSVADKMDFLAGLKEIQRRKGYKSGWVYAIYREKYGKWPPGSKADKENLQPRYNRDAANYWKYLCIKRAKSNAKQSTQASSAAQA